MTIAVDPADFGSTTVVDTRADVRRLPGIVTAACTSIGAGAVHAGAIGIHAEHPQLARIFVAVAVLQLGAGLLALVRPNRLVALGVAAVNAAAVGGWIVTRVAGISWIDGLEVKEAPQFTDTVCALMGMAAIGAALAAALVGWHMARPARLFFPALAAVALTVPAMVSGSTHAHAGGHGDEATVTHGHGDETAAAAGGAGGPNGVTPVVAADADHPHEDGATDEHHDTATTDAPADDDATATNEDTAHGPDEDAAAHNDDDTHADDADDSAHSDDDAAHADDDAAHADDDAAHADDAAHGDDDAEHADHDDTPATNNAGQSWPWPFDPAEEIDLSGVPGVTPVQLARAEGLVKATLEQLPQFADVDAIGALGYSSIGDGGTGHEHWINRTLIDGDDKFLDPSAPESLVFAVDKVTGEKTLVSAMFIAKTGTPMDAFKLTDYAGPLMTWHAHNNLCWAPNAEGKPVIVGLIDAQGNCARGVRGGGDNPMVHVWITPHQCGPFAALEGVGAGAAAVSEEERTDMCQDHGDHGDEGGEGHDEGHEAESTARPYDPTKPIDLSGFEGVTEEQQAAAENLIAVTIVRLPQWSDYKVAEAAGFHSIGDGVTGHEHFIQWDWINDDVFLDPDFPESLVYEPQPDGTKKLVSAMYMLPRTVALEDVPDIGGALMQWHIHDNLCFTKDPVAPRVAGLTDAQGNCPSTLQKFDPAPMIHVWITPHKCGPFAALEGVGAGAIAEGEERLCDHVHGSGGF